MDAQVLQPVQYDTADFYYLSTPFQPECATVVKMESYAEETPAKRLRRLRLMHERTLAELAEALGTAEPSRISHYESGKTPIDRNAAVVLAPLLRTSAAHLLCLDNENPVLSDDEKEIVAALRLLPGDLRDDFLKRIRSLAVIHAPTKSADNLVADALEGATRVSRAINKKKKEASSADARGKSRSHRAGRT